MEKSRLDTEETDTTADGDTLLRSRFFVSHGNTDPLLPNNDYTCFEKGQNLRFLPRASEFQNIASIRKKKSQNKK